MLFVHNSVITSMALVLNIRTNKIGVMYRCFVLTPTNQMGEIGCSLYLIRLFKTNDNKWLILTLSFFCSIPIIIDLILTDIIYTILNKSSIKPIILISLSSVPTSQFHNNPITHHWITTFFLLTLYQWILV